MTDASTQASSQNAPQPCSDLKNGITFYSGGFFSLQIGVVVGFSRITTLPERQKTGPFTLNATFSSIYKASARASVVITANNGLTWCWAGETWSRVYNFHSPRKVNNLMTGCSVSVKVWSLHHATEKQTVNLNIWVYLHLFAIGGLLNTNRVMGQLNVYKTWIRGRMVSRPSVQPAPMCTQKKGKNELNTYCLLQALKCVYSL